MALLRKQTCNLRHSMHLYHPVANLKLSNSEIGTLMSDSYLEYLCENPIWDCSMTFIWESRWKHRKRDMPGWKSNSLFQPEIFSFWDLNVFILRGTDLEKTSKRDMIKWKSWIISLRLKHSHFEARTFSFWCEHNFAPS